MTVQEFKDNNRLLYTQLCNAITDNNKVDTLLGILLDAGSIEVAAGDDGLDAGTIQEALQALATRVEALENP